VAKTYDGTTSATLAPSNYSLSGVIGSDLVSLNDPAQGSYADASVGNNKTVSVASLALTGATAGDYTVNPTAAANIGTITAAPTTPTPTPAPPAPPNAAVPQIPAPPGVEQQLAGLTNDQGVAGVAAPSNSVTFELQADEERKRKRTAQPVTQSGNGDRWMGGGQAQGAAP